MKALHLYSYILLLFLCMSCSDNDDYTIVLPPEEIPPPVDTTSIRGYEDVKLYYTDADGMMAEYNAVRIGEYLWMDNNFNHHNPLRYSHSWEVPYIGGGYYIAEEDETPITQEILNKYLERIFIDPALYQINIDDFYKYYGRHYSRKGVEYMYFYGKIQEGEQQIERNWSYPAISDFQQLFAMCEVRREDGILQEQDVRADLSTPPGRNPLAFNMGTPPYRVYWFENTTDRYRFNLMPAGARLNGDGWWSNGLGPNNGAWWGEYGDIYHLFYTANFPTVERDTKESGSMTIHDYLSPGPKGWHWLTVRWCRKLSDNELGYKLYIDNQRTDIRKLGLNETPPSGYRELENGYLRGFYVQYILDQENPTKTISEIVEMAEKTEEYHSSTRQAGSEN